MNDENLRLSAAVCSMPADDADKLLRAADGDCALLYLWLLRGRPAADFCRLTGVSSERAEAAAAKLRAMELLAGGGAKLPPAENERPEYTAEEIVRRAGEDSSFRGILSEAERVAGHTLSGADTRILFGIYDYVGLPTDVIIELLHYCADECRVKYGPGRVPTMRQVEKEAYIWSNREIMTLDMAEEYIRAREKLRDSAETLRRAFGIRDRELTASERKYIETWLAMGFPSESLEMAYDRTVTNIGQLRWNYMNKIVLSWHEKGLHTPDEIESGDGPRKTVSRNPQNTKTGAQGGDLEQLRKIYDKVKKS